MRICSLVPSATETLFALGAGSMVAGVTFECDFPPEASQKQIIVRARLPHSTSAAEIDRQVSDFVARGESLYEVDREAIEAIQPDLILTQDLCHVCAASPGDLAFALQNLPQAPEILSLNPQSLADVWSDIEKIGNAAGFGDQARRLIQELKERTAAVERAVAQAESKPRVACLEWLDPPFAAGHWVLEMVACAGGTDVLGRAGERAFRTTWEAVMKTQPEVVVIMPCGYDLRHTLEEFNQIDLPAGWDSLPAVREGRVFAVNGSGYFSRPGPRLAGGVEILASVIHPRRAPVAPPPASVENVPLRKPSIGT